MARTRNRATAPIQKTPLVPYATVERLNFWQWHVLVVDPTEPFFNKTVYNGTHIGEDRASHVAQRKLDRYLRDLSYTREPIKVYRAKPEVYR